ncbi:hypothetical protein BSPWISOXPB_11388 [uncultured Gammaproteobacteria bacterium]|nr:hypothetical protein BSPWISOXPB_11388 [uncultured Gammaproteobacteria bacterium]
MSAGAKVGAKVRAFGVAKVGVNADIGSANQEWIYGQVVGGLRVMAVKVLMVKLEF